MNFRNINNCNCHQNITSSKNFIAPVIVAVKLQLSTLTLLYEHSPGSLSCGKHCYEIEWSEFAIETSFAHIYISFLVRVLVVDRKTTGLKCGKFRPPVREAVLLDCSIEHFAVWGVPLTSKKRERENEFSFHSEAFKIVLGR